MIYQLDPHYLGFPDPEEAEPDGIIAIGGEDAQILAVVFNPREEEII